MILILWIWRNEVSVSVNFFIPGMLIGSIVFYYFPSFLVTVTLAGGHKVSGKQVFSIGVRTCTD